MKKFNYNRLPFLVRGLYNLQNKLLDKNIKDTFVKHNKDIEELLETTKVFDVWKDILRRKGNETIKIFMPEIFMDAYISVYFASIGLYKQANVSLRAQLETVLRLVYFSRHPVEFSWWQEGKDYFKNKDVWFEDYIYFRRLQSIKQFQKISKKQGNNIILLDEIRKLYSLLSKYVHSRISSFQTSPVRFTPKYSNKEFRDWSKNFNKSKLYINLLLALGFSNEFENTTVTNQKKVLIAIKNSKLKKALRKSLNLKIVGVV